MADYNVEMFKKDYESLIPVIMESRSIETLDMVEKEAGSEKITKGITQYFTSTYGNARGIDFEMRFMSVMQFLEHYWQDLLNNGFIKQTEDMNTRVPDEVLTVLLESIRSPQPPNRCGSSPLYNDYHEFNYKKVIKALKTTQNVKK